MNLASARKISADLAHVAFKTAFRVQEDSQSQLLEQAFGTARFAYNWSLERWEARRKEKQANSFQSLRNDLNAIKREQYPWMLTVPKDVPAEAIRDLCTAFANFFDPKLKARYPRRKKKGKAKFSFRLPSDRLGFRYTNEFHQEIAEVRLSSLGWVKLCEPFTPSGRITQVTVSRRGDCYFISFCMEYQAVKRVKQIKKPKSVGIDLGLLHTAVLSNGSKIEGPRSLAGQLCRLARANRRLHRRERGSKNRKKAARKVGRLHQRVADIRRDFTEKTTTMLLRRYDIIAIEDLNVQGLIRNRRLARSFADAGLGHFAATLERKASKYGCLVTTVDRFFPSSKQCRLCQIKNHDLSLSDRTFYCANAECRHAEDRDVHAAKNIHKEGLRLLPAASGEATSVEILSLPGIPQGVPGKRSRRSRKWQPRGVMMSNTDGRQNTSHLLSLAE